MPGSCARIGILRNAHAETITATIRALPENLQTSRHAPIVNIPCLHIQVQALTPQAMKGMDIHHGVLILAVARGPVAMAGIKPGMVIQQIAQEPVDTPVQLQKIVAKLPADQPIGLGASGQGQHLRGHHPTQRKIGAQHPVVPISDPPSLGRFFCLRN